MTWQAWFTLATVFGALAAMASDKVSPDRATVGALALLILAGVVTPTRALAGFANEGMMTVALLFVVAAAIRRSGALGALSQRILGRPKTAAAAQLRLMVPVAGASAFINNTPLVAMLLPEVRDWARLRGVAPSRLLIPLSYAAILGGVCTLIGTSTNLVVHGLLQQAGYPGLGFFDLSPIGIPFALVGILFVVLLGRRLLPDRPQGAMPLADPRAFTAVFGVDPAGPLVGKRLGDVAIPDVPMLNPIEIERAGEFVPAPRGDEILRANDRLVVNAAMGEVRALERTPGLTPVADHAFTREGNARRVLVELVVSGHCPLVGHVVGTGAFRQMYDAAIVAVARHGARVVQRREGGWLLESGDTLLVEASDDFLALHLNNPDFYLVTSHGRVEALASWHRPFSLAVFLIMIGCAATEVLSTFEAALGAALVLLLSGVISWRQAQSDVDWSVLLVIATAFGLSAALEQSGAASGAAGALVALGSDSPWLTLALIYVATVITTEVVSNNAAAALMLPIALSAAAAMGVPYMPYAIAVIIGASAGFATPIGYQTHLMVYGAGGYRFTDFTRIGVPLGITLGVMVVALIPILWPL
jgi:di/tricarboxylate transporter